MQTLRQKYCPPLDDALFYAITSDYDIPRDIALVTEILDGLRLSAVEQEDLEFDPSGTGGSRDIGPGAHNSHSSPERESGSHDVTSAATGLTDYHDSGERVAGEEIQNLPPEEKERWLQKLFPNIEKNEIRRKLKAHDGSIDKVIDELLNLSFLDHEDSPRPKGVDGLADEGQAKQRKGRSKRKARVQDSSRASSTTSTLSGTSTQVANVWGSLSDDVEFICSRTALLPQTVKSAYHANGARLSTTVRALSEKEGQVYRKTDEVDPNIQLQIADFKAEFEQIPDATIYGTLVLARNIPSAAYELFEAMLRQDQRLQPETIPIAQYVPLDLSESTPIAHRNESSAPWTQVDYTQVRGLAIVNGAAASQAFNQASTAHRRGKSDRLMGGAAAYYASVGHERLKAAKEYQAGAADALVSGQSSSTVLDLHGVSVAEAVRIASQRTRYWWQSLGDAKYASGGGGPARAGYKIITGIGSHSKNHAPRIGPAVSKMLVREGWRIEIGHGELIVTGKARR